ncbi:hypothetical protein CIB48_g7785 [Xylaria polymorpha]|nr:hypothetical protein CIB48_g7785 [Xylaria polymorpha]
MITCQKIVYNFGAFTLNDCVGTISGCGSSLIISTTATSGPPPAEHAGVIPFCTGYYKVVSEDSCSEIVEDYGEFTLSNFRVRLFPQFLGYYVYVGIRGTPTSRSAIPSPTMMSTPISSTPTQSGASANCKTPPL